MRIAILGTRGIPARYGGFETFAEELAVRLAKRGHQVTVYCRERYFGPSSTSHTPMGDEGYALIRWKCCHLFNQNRSIIRIGN